MKNEILSIIKTYEDDYNFMAEQDKLYHDSSTKSENEARESEMALIDGFISILKEVIK